MFLRGLNEEKKQLFLELCVHAALANHIIAEQEHAAMQYFAAEMGLSEYPTKISIPLDDLLEDINSKCTREEINIFVLETVGLVLSDHIYDADEQKFIKTLEQRFSVSSEKMEEAFSLVRNWMKLYAETKSFIDG
jgi:hypothetical protein